jgi:hypothetical protein
MSILEFAAIIALCGYSVYRQTKTNDVFGHYRFKMALIYGIVGVCIGVHIPHTIGAEALLLVSLAASVWIGAVRGRHTRIWRGDDGRIYSRGTVFTVSAFLLLIAFKFALGTGAHFAHVSYGSSFGEILLMIGLMACVQAELVWRRAKALRDGGGWGAEPPVLVGSAR